VGRQIVDIVAASRIQLVAMNGISHPITRENTVPWLDEAFLKDNDCGPTSPRFRDGTKP
jgi:hypothetical protein